MKATEFLQFLHRIETLKTNARHCVTAGGVPESVAAHSWRMAVMAMLCADEFPEMDMDRVIRMCLTHDFGEAVTGDIPSFVKTEENEAEERHALSALVDTLPSPQRDELATLYAEMDAQETPEARLYKTIDKLEAVIQHNESDISSWIPREYTLNLTYGEENAAQFPFLAAVRAQMKRDTEEKICAAYAGGICEGPKDDGTGE